MLFRSANTQYTQNASNGNNWLTTIDSSLSATTDIMNRVRDLVVRGANDGSMSATAKEAIATELEGLRSDLLKQANTSYLGRSVYAGNSDAGAAFSTDTATGVITFNGSPGSTVERRIGSDSTIRVDADGSAVYGTGTDSVFSLIDTIVGDLRTGVNVGVQLGAIDTRMKAITNAHTDIGARQAQILTTQETLLSTSGALETQRSSIEDVEINKIILDLKQAQVNYESALAVTAKVLQPTLMDFLN